MKRLSLTLLTLVFGLAPARAEPAPAPLVEAYRAWLDATGLANRGGYGR